MTGPLRAVLAAVDSGASTVIEVSRQTGLDRDLVAAAIAHLIRIGRVSTTQLVTGCPATGCGGCALACPER